MEHIQNVPYSKEENAIVERSNKEIMRHLRNIIFDDRVAKKMVNIFTISTKSTKLN